MRFWKIPFSKEGELNLKEVNRKLLYINIILIVVFSILLGFSAYIALFMPSTQVLYPININILKEGEWKQKIPIESYIDGPKSIKTSIIKDSGRNKFIRLNAVNDSATFSGLTFQVNRPVPENTKLSLQWRSAGHTPEIIIDVMDGSISDVVKSEQETIDFGENYTAVVPAPANRWSNINLQLDTLQLNPEQETGKILDGIFDFNRVRQVSVSISPESELTLDVIDLHFFWETKKWLLSLVYFLISLVGLFLIIRTNPEKFLLNKGNVLITKSLTSRIVYCLLSLSALASFISKGPVILEPGNLVLYAVLFIFVVMGELITFVKPHPIWTLRYAIALFIGYYMGFSAGILSISIILLAVLIPLIQLERFRILFWIVIFMSVLGYVVVPYHDNHFTHIAGFIMIVCSFAAAIIYRGYLGQNNKDSILEQALLQYETLFKKTSDAIFILDQNGSIVTVNQSFERLTGYELSDLKGKNISSLVCPDCGENVQNMLKTATENNLQQNDIQFINKNNEIRTALVRCSVINHDDQITGYQALATDITERKIAEEKLEATVKLLERKAAELAELNALLKISGSQLSELNASKDRFFSIISHDLRNPFHSLLGLSNIIANDLEDLSGEEIKTFAAHINAKAENIYKLLENLLQWANIQNGKLVYEFTEINLFDLVESVFDILRDNADKKNIKFKNAAGKDLYVYADFNSINSVLQNLITNAIKFTNFGGQIIVSSVKDGKLIEITVADTGIGMNSAVLGKLFRIDVHHTTEGTANEPGTGLGLILCKEMIEKNGGTIRVESEIGRGSRFIFTLTDLESLENRDAIYN